MSALTLWAVYTNSDLTEGRGRQYAKHFCKTKATALRLAKGGYVQGTDCPVKPVKALELDGKHVLPTSLLNIVHPTAEDEAMEIRMTAKQQALGKAQAAGLTDEEIKLLGGRL